MKKYFLSYDLYDKLGERVGNISIEVKEDEDSYLLDQLIDPESPQEKIVDNMSSGMSAVLSNKIVVE